MRRCSGPRTSRARWPDPMAVLIDESTRVVIQGLTGEQGRFYSLRNRATGTEVVAGVTPGKGGQDVEGIPVFDTFHDAVQQAGANTAMVFVPPGSRPTRSWRPRTPGRR